MIVRDSHLRAPRPGRVASVVISSGGSFHQRSRVISKKSRICSSTFQQHVQMMIFQVMSLATMLCKEDETREKRTKALVCRAVPIGQEWMSISANYFPVQHHLIQLLTARHCVNMARTKFEDRKWEWQCYCMLYKCCIDRHNAFRLNATKTR